MMMMMMMMMIFHRSWRGRHGMSPTRLTWLSVASCRACHQTESSCETISRMSPRLNARAASRHGAEMSSAGL